MGSPGEEKSWQSFNWFFFCFFQLIWRNADLTSSCSMRNVYDLFSTLFSFSAFRLIFYFFLLACCFSFGRFGKFEGMLSSCNQIRIEHERVKTTSMEFEISHFFTICFFVAPLPRFQPQWGTKLFIHRNFELLFKRRTKRVEGSEFGKEWVVWLDSPR